MYVVEKIFVMDQPVHRPLKPVYEDFGQAVSRFQEERKKCNEGEGVCIVAENGNRRSTIVESIRG